MSSTNPDAGNRPDGASSEPDPSKHEVPPSEAHDRHTDGIRPVRRPLWATRVPDAFERISPGPLTKEQIAYYRDRLDTGYYTSNEVQQHIVERLIEELVPPRKK